MEYLIRKYTASNNYYDTIAKRRVSVLDLFDLIRTVDNIKVVTDYGQHDITEEEVRNAYAAAIKLRAIYKLNYLTKTEMIDMIKQEVDNEQV